MEAQRSRPDHRDSKRTHIGYEHVHAAVDDHSRLAYVEIHDTNNGQDSAGFITRAIAWFANHGITVEAVMTDNHSLYVNSTVFQQALSQAGVRHVRISPRRAQVNGKVERFNRTLLEDWAYQRLSPATRSPTSPAALATRLQPPPRPHRPRRPLTH